MEDNILLTILGIMLVVSLVGTGFAWSAANSETEVTVEVDFSEVNAKLDALGAGQVSLSTRIDGIETPEIVIVEGEDAAVPGDYIRNQGEYEEDMSDAEALRLAELSVNLDDRDFRKALFNALVDFGVDIEDRDDITEVRYNTDVDGDEVEFDSFRVWYFIDGDDEENEKAKLDRFFVEVRDLDFDDDFEDAEVNEDYMDDLMVLKVYD